MSSGVEALLLKYLAPSVAKAVIRVWSGDTTASDVSGVVVGWASGQALSRREQRDAQRQFDSAGERAAERLLPFFEAEFSGTPANEVEAALVAVQRSLDAAFSGRAVDSTIAVDLDPIALERTVRAHFPDAARDALLSESGTAVFDFLLREACAVVVQMVQDLPTFSREALAELLKRTARIEQVLADALAAMPLAVSVDDHDSFETMYRRAIASRLDWINLFGVRNIDRAARRYALSLAYVSLDASAEAGNVDVDIAEGASLDKSLERLVLDRPRLIVAGAAGSGKTTALQWLAVRAAKQGFEDQFSPLNRCVPIYVRLRDYSETDLPNADEAVRRMAGPGADLKPKGWAGRALMERPVLLLVDGLDELREDRRDEVSSWLADFEAVAFDLRVVATSRPAALMSWALPDGYQVADLAPMSLADIDCFIDRWHDAVAMAEASSSPDPSDGTPGESAATVKRAVRVSVPVRRLATNPLMCAVICAISREGSGSLPKDRLELYDIALTMLIDKRDRVRGIVMDFDLTLQQKRAILEDVAWWMTRNNWASVSQVDLEAQLARLRIRMAISQSAEQILRYLLERTGVLRQPVEGTIDFVHKTFMEYLAARRATVDNDFGLVESRAHEAGFSEVCVLVSGMASASQRDSLISSLLKRADSMGGPYQDVLLLVAAQCVDLAVDLDPKLRDEVAQAMARLIPPRRLTDGERLALAGEAIVPMLPFRSRLTGQQARACVRALARVGSSSALDQLRTYGHDRRVVVYEELLNMWGQFDPARYAEAVLSRSGLNGGVLRIGPELTAGVRYLPELRQLTIYAGDVGVDWESVSACRKLIILDVPSADAAYFESFEPLRKMADLELLDLSFLSECVSLQGLPTSLRHVSLAGLRNLRDLHGLGREPRPLEGLWLAGTGPLSLDGIGSLDRLETLSIEGFEISNIDAIAELPALRKVSLKVPEAHPLDLKALERLPELREVSLVLGNLDVAPRFLSRPLDVLSVYATRLPTLSGLGALSNAMHVRLDEVPVRTLSGLEGAQLIERLELVDMNRLESLAPLPPNLLELAVGSGYPDSRAPGVPTTQLSVAPIVSSGSVRSVVLHTALCEVDGLELAPKLESVMLTNWLGTYSGVPDTGALEAAGFIHVNPPPSVVERTRGYERPSAYLERG